MTDAYTLVLTFDAALELADIRRERGIPASPVHLIPWTPSFDEDLDDPDYEAAGPPDSPREPMTADHAAIEMDAAWRALAARGQYPSCEAIGREIGWAKITVHRWQQRLMAAGRWHHPKGKAAFERSRRIRFRREAIA
jgi:hypothetical protein